MKIVTVMPLKKGVFKEDLTYFTNQEIESGDVVEIPVRSKKILGLVASVQDASLMKADIKSMQYNLKKIIEKKKDMPVIMLTGTSNENIVDTLIKQYGVGLILKPFKNEEFYSIIEKKLWTGKQ